MTIYALSSGPGVSGVAIIRISGSEASKVIKSLTGKEISEPRDGEVKIHLKRVFAPPTLLSTPVSMHLYQAHWCAWRFRMPSVAATRLRQSPWRLSVPPDASTVAFLRCGSSTKSTGCIAALASHAAGLGVRSGWKSPLMQKASSDGVSSGPKSPP